MKLESLNSSKFGVKKLSPEMLMKVRGGAPNTSTYKNDKGGSGTDRVSYACCDDLYDKTTIYDYGASVTDKQAVPWPGTGPDDY